MIPRRLLPHLRTQGSTRKSLALRHRDAGGEGRAPYYRDQHENAKRETWSRGDSGCHRSADLLATIDAGPRLGTGGQYDWGRLGLLYDSSSHRILGRGTMRFIMTTSRWMCESIA